MRLRPALAIGGSIVCCFGVGLVVDRMMFKSHPQPVAAPVPTVALVRQELEDRYVRPLDARAMHAPTIPALIASLDDRYTVYLNPNQYRSFLNRSRPPGSAWE